MDSVIIGRILFAICSVGILVTVTIVPLSIFNISSTEYALRYNDLTKNVDSQVYGEGKYTFTPQTTMFYYKKIVKTNEYKELICLTKDGVQVTMNIDVDYQLIKDELFDIFWEFGKEDNLQYLISNVVHDSVRDSCSHFNYTNFPSNRDGVQSLMENNLKADISNSNGHCEVQSLRLVNYNFPTSLNDAIDNKQLSLQDTESANNEREVKIASAEAELTIQNIKSQTIIDVAIGKAYEITLEGQKQADTIQSIWGKRKLTYSTLMTELGMNVDTFVTDYLYGVVLESHSNIITNL